MKTILHNKTQQRSKAGFLIATLIFMLFAIKSQSQNCGAGFMYFTNGNVVTFVDSSYAMPGDSIIGWSWVFGDGSGGTGNFINHQYNSPGIYTVCLTITTALGCSNTNCQVVTIQGNPCQLNAYILPDSSGSGLYVATSGGTAPFNYLWSTGATTSYISSVLPGLYCVTVYDANGCSASDCDSGGFITCSPYFTYNNSIGTVQFNNYSVGQYTSVLWDFGDSTTSTLLNPSHTYANPGSYNVCLTLIDSLGNACNQYCQNIFIQAPFNSTLCGTIFVDYNGNGVFDSLDTYLSNQYVMIYGMGMQFTGLTDSMGYYQVSVPAGTYTIQYCTNIGGAIVTLPIDSSIYCGVYYSVTVIANQTSCGYNFAVQYTSVTIEGNVFADINLNGVFDAGEPGIPYQLVNIGLYSAYTNTNGHYSLFIPAGIYSVQYAPQGAYSSYSLTTAGSITVNAATVGQIYGGNNFGINIPPGTTDLSVQLIPHTTVTPGFPAWYDIYVCNNGIIPVAANLVMIYDQNLTFDNAYPVQTTHNAGTQTLTWNLPIILPGDCQLIWVDFSADSLLALGISTFEFVSVSPATGTDNNLSNNTDTIHQIVVGSWDPNNKLSVKTNNNDPNKQFVSSVNPDQEITYTVNFQNTGSANAVNVVVIDQLSADLNANSFQLMATSHTCNVVRTGNQVVYTFSNIMLPDSGTNQIGSHGFIAFKANANSGLAAGTIISDNASIYFDLNQPVITGNTHIVMIDPLTVGELPSTGYAIHVYPNPVKEFAVIDYAISSTSSVKLEIMDINGKICEKLVDKNHAAGNYTVNWTNNLSAGTYFVKLAVNDKVSFMKINVIK